MEHFEEGDITMDSEKGSFRLYVKKPNYNCADGVHIYYNPNTTAYVLYTDGSLSLWEKRGTEKPVLTVKQLATILTKD